MITQQVQIMAQMAHNIIIQYCVALGNEAPPAWEDASDELKASAYNGVLFHLENPQAKASDSHENWYKFKEAQGWKKGRKKDEEKKTHPCMVPFDKLPEYQQAKDYIFKAVIDNMRGLSFSRPVAQAAVPNKRLQALKERTTPQKRGIAKNPKKKPVAKKATPAKKAPAKKVASAAKKAVKKVTKKAAPKKSTKAK